MRRLYAAAVQALLDAPMFGTRWRWVAGVALALPRFRGGKKVPPQLMRMMAEDLVAAIFPDQVACAENLVGEREVPDHPLVRQTIADCLNEAMDIGGLERLLAGIEAGAIRIVARDLTEPSPLALEVLSRAALCLSRRCAARGAPHPGGDEPALARSGGRQRYRPPRSEAISRCVRSVARSRDADELHDALVWLGFLGADRGGGCACLGRLVRRARRRGGWRCCMLRQSSSPPWKRGSRCRWISCSRGNDDKAYLGAASPERRVGAPSVRLWIAAERLPQFQALWPGARNRSADHHSRRSMASALVARGGADRNPARPIRGSRAGRRGALAAPLGIEPDEIAAALAALEAEGFAMRGRFTPGTSTRNGASAGCSHACTAIRSSACAPRSSRWPRAISCASCSVGSGSPPMRAWKGRMRLKSWSASSKVSKRRPVPGRPRSCRRGSPATSRPGSTIAASPGASPGRGLSPVAADANGSERRATPVRTTPITLLARRHAAALGVALDREPARPAEPARADGRRFHPPARRLVLRRAGRRHRPVALAGRRGARRAGGARPRHLGQFRRPARLACAVRPAQAAGRRPAPAPRHAVRHGGRRPLGARAPRPGAARPEPEAVEHLARTLLRRYGVVFWRLLEREADWLPPWRDLLRVYRRLEARGEIRGGRFVAGFSGEQFALPEAVGMLREVRRKPRTEAWCRCPAPTRSTSRAS